MGLPHSKVIVEMNKLGYSEMSSERKCDRLVDRLNNSFSNHAARANYPSKDYKYIENKTQWNQNFYIRVLFC